MNTEQSEPIRAAEEASSISPEEHARMLSTLVTLGLGRFRVKSEHEHRLDWEREYRSHP